MFQINMIKRSVRVPAILKKPFVLFVLVVLGVALASAISVKVENKFFVSENGNVGIGTENPSEKLDVVGVVKSNSVLTSSVSSSGDLTLNAPGASGDILFNTNGARRLQIYPNGNVEVNTGDLIVEGDVSGGSVTSGVATFNTLNAGAIPGFCRRVTDGLSSGSSTPIVEAACSSGEMVVGGGGICSSGYLKLSHPHGSGGAQRWRIQCSNSGDFTAFAICCKFT